MTAGGVNNGTVVLGALLVAVLVFLWQLHGEVRGLDQDIRTLSDRVARIEGLLEGMQISAVLPTDQPGQP